MFFHRRKIKGQRQQQGFLKSLARILNTIQGLTQPFMIKIIHKNELISMTVVLIKINTNFTLLETLWSILESTRCQCSCSKVKKKNRKFRLYQIFFHIFKNMLFTDILPKLRAEFTFRSRIANLASNMIRLVLLDEIY